LASPATAYYGPRRTRGCAYRVIRPEAAVGYSRDHHQPHLTDGLPVLPATLGVHEPVDPDIPRLRAGHLDERLAAGKPLFDLVELANGLGFRPAAHLHVAEHDV
jgi:hypothetical protein